MKKFINDNFLLETDFAVELYHNYAKPQPIIDYHNHLLTNEIASNKSFDNMTEIWLKGDHYKWRAMRAFGIPEKHITGNSSNFEKFDKWAEVLPYTMRNPLFHWSQLELKRYFDVDEYLNPKTASAIYEHCNNLLQTPEYSTQGLLKRANAEILCSTDDPLSDLSHHQKIANSDFDIQVLPTFRPDGIINIEKSNFVDYINKLSKVTDINITDLTSLLEATKSRIDYFHKNGCRLSDHGLSHAYADKFTQKEINTILENRLANNNISATDIAKFKSAILFYLGKFYAEKDWTMQLHLGALRDANKGLLRKIGADVGVDSIGDYQQAEVLANFLNKLNENESLPKTILYNLNPGDNDVFATMAGNFSEDGIKGKIQYGAAWWFMDQKDGIKKQIDSHSNMGLISCSLGMLTDSRSFLSFPRHEYYRRILCNIFGNDIKNGDLPNDIKWIGKIIEDICYHNAKEYFNFPSLVKNKIKETV